jgi:hypothetical protein
MTLAEFRKAVIVKLSGDARGMAVNTTAGGWNNNQFVYGDDVGGCVQFYEDCAR